MRLQLTLLAAFVAIVAAEQPFDWEFKQFDLDNNTVMTENELVKQFETLVDAAKNVSCVSCLLQIRGRNSSELAKAAMERFDEDKTGFLDLQEWNALAHYVVNFNVKPSAGMREAFKRMDGNTDAMLEQWELENAFQIIINNAAENKHRSKALAEINGRNNTQLAKEALKYFDKDNDTTKLSYLEYRPLAHYVWNILDANDDSVMNMAFNKYDKNGDNAWDHEEITKSFVDLLAFPANHKNKIFLNEIGRKKPEDWANFVMENLDLDGNKKLSKFEWIPLALYIDHMTQVSVQTATAGLVWEFRQLDLNSNGVMEKDELIGQFEKLIQAAHDTKSLSMLMQIRGRSAQNLANDALNEFAKKNRETLNLQEWIQLADYIVDFNIKPNAGLIQAFKEIDTSKDHFLDDTELVEGFNVLIEEVNRKNLTNKKAFEEINNSWGSNGIALKNVALEHFDKDRDGKLNYNEYAPMGQYVWEMLKGEDNSPMNMAFERFDEDKDNTWNEKEVLKSFEVLLKYKEKYNVKLVYKNLGKQSAEDLTELVMNYADLSGDRKLEKIEWVQVAFYIQFLYNLLKTQMSSLEWAFHELDLNHNEVMEQSELKRQFEIFEKAAIDLRSLSMMIQIHGKNTDDLIKSALEKFDKDKPKGSLDFNEWKNLANYVVKFNVEPSSGARMTFKKLDLSKDKLLNRAELEISFGSFIKRIKTLSKYKFAVKELAGRNEENLTQDALIHFDQDSDTKLTLKEFVPLYHYVEHVLGGKNNNKMNNLFKEFDSNTDDLWDREELKKSFGKLIKIANKEKNYASILKEIEGQTPDTLATVVMDNFDFNKDDKLTKMEWISVALYLQETYGPKQTNENSGLKLPNTQNKNTHTRISHKQRNKKEEQQQQQPKKISKKNEDPKIEKK